VPAIVKAYGAPSKIAGKGKIRRKGRNGWKPEFKNAPALQAELSRPHIAMADRTGAIYVADKDAHGIRKIALDSSISTVAGTNQAGDDGDQPGTGTDRRLSSPNGLWVREDGTVYILDLGNSKIRRLDTSGQLTTLFPVPGGISIGRGLWVRDDEQLAFIASNSKVLKWTPTTGVSTLADGFSSLANLVVDSNDQLLVTDRVAGLVYRVTMDGKRSVIAGNGKATGGGNCQQALRTSLPGVRAVWLHPQGGFFLGTHESSRVWYVDPSGIIHLVLDEKTVSEVRGISMDSRQNLIVVDDDHGFIRLLKKR